MTSAFGHVLLHAADEVPEGLAFRPSSRVKTFLPRLLLDDRLVDVHGRSRLALDRLGHEGGVGVVLHRRLADGALEQEHLVGQFDGIAVAQVDLELARTLLVDERVDLEPLALGEMVDVVDQLVELVDRRRWNSRRRRRSDARAPDRRNQRIVRVGVLAHEIELDLRRDDRPPAMLAIGLDDAPQHVARVNSTMRPSWCARSQITCAVGSLLPRHDRQRR
jgi:hypothetical protein